MKTIIPWSQEGKKKSQAQENRKKSTPRQGIIKLLLFSKDKILKATRGKKTLQTEKKNQRMTTDFLTEMKQVKR